MRGVRLVFVVGARGAEARPPILNEAKYVSSGDNFDLSPAQSSFRSLPEYLPGYA